MHGECLATAGLTVRKYCRVEAIDSCLDERTYCCCIDTPCVIFGTVHSVKSPPLQVRGQLSKGVGFLGWEHCRQTSSCWTFAPHLWSLRLKMLCFGLSSSPSQSGFSPAPLTGIMTNSDWSGRTPGQIIELVGKMQAYHNTDILPRLGHGGRDGLQSDLKHIWRFRIYCFDS